MRTNLTLSVAGLLAMTFPGVAVSQDNASLAQELANPIAAIYSFPLEYEYNNIGPNGKGSLQTLSLSPVVPFELDNGAAIVTRTIFSKVWAEYVPGTTVSGFDDVLFSAWYSDVAQNELIWGLGPVVNIPTGSAVSTDTWALGVSGIAVKVSGPWTYGVLAHHLRDFESSPSTPIEETFVWPWVSYTTPSAWTFSATSEALYDATAGDWLVPVDLVVSKLTQSGNIPINWQLSLGYWAKSPANGPGGARVSLMAQIVLPKKK